MADSVCWGDMDHQLIQLKASDGTWDAFEAEWRAQCEGFGEDFEQFAQGTISLLRDEAKEQRADLGVFALRADDGTCPIVAQVNSSDLPGYDGKVLRIRHMLMSPDMDFGELTVDDYSLVLSRMFSRTVQLALRTMPSRHVKFHLRSPADRQFFSSVIETLRDFEIFTSVAIRGAWLYLTLKFADVDTAGDK